ncbi:MAG: GNAT family N-acetyltransferase [Phycisphaerae bacterium]
MAISATWIDSISQLDPVFVNQCFPAPLEGGWWYAALEQAELGDQFQFSYLILKQDGRNVGIAPAFTMDVPMELVAPPLVNRVLQAGGRLLAGLRHQKTLFVGSPCSDEGTVGFIPGVKLADFVSVIAVELEQRGKASGASLLVWKDFPAAYWPTLNTLIPNRKYFKIPSFPGTTVPLPPGGYDAYLKQLDSENRYKLRKKLRKSHAMGELIVSCVQQPDPQTQAEIFTLFMNTYHRGKVKFERLTPQFFASIARAPDSWFLILRDTTNHNMVAFMLLFVSNGKAINKFIGLDYNYGGDWFMYFRLWDEAVRWATAMGANQLQSGQTGYFAKRDVGHKLIELCNYCRHRNALLNAILAAVGKRITWATLDPDLPARACDK